MHGGGSLWWIDGAAAEDEPEQSRAGDGDGILRASQWRRRTSPAIAGGLIAFSVSSLFTALWWGWGDELDEEQTGRGKWGIRL